MFDESINHIFNYITTQMKEQSLSIVLIALVILGWGKIKEWFVKEISGIKDLLLKEMIKLKESFMNEISKMFVKIDVNEKNIQDLKDNNQKAIAKADKALSQIAEIRGELRGKGK